eukprot:SAG31_NODE_5846_length_2298_cov_2.012733_2_plen_221_part_00
MASQTGFGVVTLAVLKTQLDDAHGWSKQADKIRLVHVAASTVIAGFGTLGAMLAAGYKTCESLSVQALSCWRTFGWKLLALLFSLVLIGFIADASDYKMMENSGDASSKHKFVVYIVLIELVLTMANLVNALGLARQESSWQDFKYQQDELQATAGAYGGQNYAQEPYIASGSAYGGAFNGGPPIGPRGGYAPAAPGRPPRRPPQTGARPPPAARYVPRA